MDLSPLISAGEFCFLYFLHKFKSYCNTIASWVFSNITHSTREFLIFFLFLRDFCLVLKLTVWPMYSDFSRIFTTLSEHQRVGYLNVRVYGNPFDLAYAVGISTPTLCTQYSCDLRRPIFLKHIREYSDRVCLAFGIQPIAKTKSKVKPLHTMNGSIRSAAHRGNRKSALILAGS